MLRRIKNCPLIATLRNGNIIVFSHDVTVKGVICMDLTGETIAEISRKMILKGIDISSVAIDEARMNYKGIEVL